MLCPPFALAGRQSSKVNQPLRCGPLLGLNKDGARVFFILLIKPFFVQCTLYKLYCKVVNYATYVREAVFQYYREDERPGSYLTPNAVQGLAADFCEGLSSCQKSISVFLLVFVSTVSGFLSLCSPLFYYLGYPFFLGLSLKPISRFLLVSLSNVAGLLSICSLVHYFLGYPLQLGLSSKPMTL